jgi:phosphoribosylformylglycinamidine cyclo-ligase
MERTFNVGVGMLAVLAPERVQDALALAAARGVPAWVCGELRAADLEMPPAVELTGSYLGAAAGWE